MTAYIEQSQNRRSRKGMGFFGFMCLGISTSYELFEYNYKPLCSIKCREILYKLRNSLNLRKTLFRAGPCKGISGPYANTNLRHIIN
jgi:hypothetical protein